MDYERASNNQKKGTSQEYPPLNQVLSRRKFKNNNTQPIQNLQRRPNGISQKQISQSKQKNGEYNQNLKMSSTEIVSRLILSPNLGIQQIQNSIIQLSGIKSLKYDKFSQRIKQILVETIFQKNHEKFIKIMQAYNPNICSVFLLQSIFHGYQLNWSRQTITSTFMTDKLFEIYINTIPNCLNKRFVEFMKQLITTQTKIQLYPQFRQKIQKYVQKILVVNSSNLTNSRKNRQNSQKIIPLVIYFDLEQEIQIKELVKLVPLEKINQYMQKRNGSQNDKIENKQQHSSNGQIKNEDQSSSINPNGTHQKPSKPYKQVPPLVHHSILQLIQKNGLKQIQKILRTYNIPYTQYPQFVQKLQIKYLQYQQRINPIYVIDQLIYNKLSLVENMIDIYIKRRKYQFADHFIHKYRLRGVKETDPKKMFSSPLVVQDDFGPTESFVLKQKQRQYYILLENFQINKEDVMLIDTYTIYQKPYTKFLKLLLSAEQIGLDSESSTGIHVFQSAKLQLIQIYDPQTNKIFLFDVKDFKNDKKKRHQRGINNSANNQSSHVKKPFKSEKIENRQPQKQQAQQTRYQKSQHGKSNKNQVIEIEDQQQENNNKFSSKFNNQQKIQQQYDSKGNKSQFKVTKQQKQQKQQTPQRTWFRFTKIIQNVFKRATIYGHALHTDLDDIFNDLGLKIKQNQLKIKDSQNQFKKYYPQQRKSALSYLAQKCYGKQISKFQQCSAWDKRPLRKAQRHYAALDAVLPYVLVKSFQTKAKQKK